MGISHTGGKLPFVVFVGEDWTTKLMEVAYEDNHASYKGKKFHREKFVFENDWTIQFDGPTIDDIYTSFTLEKDVNIVYFGDLYEGEPFFCANDENSLKAFKKDFNIQEEIEKNLKVIQTL